MNIIDWLNIPQMKDKLRTPEQGADTAVWLAVSPAALQQPSGLFFQGEALQHCVLLSYCVFFLYLLCVISNAVKLYPVYLYPYLLWELLALHGYIKWIVDSSFQHYPLLLWPPVLPVSFNVSAALS